ncbi:MAG TPA: ATP-binding protein, partial [Anaerolineales bacterium]|nr:ATP-binding protein [Anaerolineales bacterium]
MLSFIRRHLGAKLFISYLIVILVGVVVLGSAAELVVPSAFDRHLAAMNGMMQQMMGRSSSGLSGDLFQNFRAAVTEALTFAALAAFLAAVLVSLFVSRQVVAPVRAMMSASQRIAEGNYADRVHVSGDLAKGEQDELAQLALSFNQMAAKLQQTENMRRQLIGDVAHELRTPLTAIKGSMEGLIDGVLPADAETFQAIHREADRLQRLVNDLQELSRVESGAFELDRQAVNVPDLLASTVARLGKQFEEKGVALETQVPSGMPQVLADKDRIDQVLLNLAGNALQYTPSDGKVILSAHSEDGEIHIAVSDNGIGVPPEHLPHLFTRFYRVDKSRSRAGGGSGIGLTIARHLV